MRLTSGIKRGTKRETFLGSLAILILRARVAQWIRAFASGAKGRRFDPCRGYQFNLKFEIADIADLKSEAAPYDVVDADEAETDVVGVDDRQY